MLSRPSPCVFFLFLFLFNAPSSVGKPLLTHADTFSMVVRLHNIPGRSLEKSHPSEPAFFLGRLSLFFSPIMAAIHTPTHRGRGRSANHPSRDLGGKNYVPPTTHRHTRLTVPAHHTCPHMPAEIVNCPPEI